MLEVFYEKSIRIDEKSITRDEKKSIALDEKLITSYEKSWVAVDERPIAPGGSWVAFDEKSMASLRKKHPSGCKTSF